MKIKLFKPAVIALAFASAFSGNLYAAQGESILTPTMKGWAPYLQRAGTIVQGRADGQTPQVKIGDVIEVPTYMIDSNWYTYKDGNTLQDQDADNEGRTRAGQFTVNVGGVDVAQKVSVHWYVVTPKAGKVWAPDGTSVADFNDPTKNSGWITDWAHIDATKAPIASYTMPVQGNKSLALKVPAEANGKRVGFIIVPESQTGDPFRGQPLKVPDLNYIWEQPQPQGPGDLCDLNNVTDSDALSVLDSCLIDPTDANKPNPPEKPVDENFGNGGGDVAKADFVVTIHYLKDPAGTPNPKTDPIVGTQAHPHPLVNSTYYASIEVLVPNADQEAVPVYRRLDSANRPSDAGGLNEIESISWNFYRGDIDETALASASDVIARNAIFTAAFIAQAKQGDATARTGAKTGVDGIQYFTFKTQVDNTEANTTFANAFITKWKWNDALINGEDSEQRTRLRVTFNYDDTDTTP